MSRFCCLKKTETEKSDRIFERMIREEWGLCYLQFSARTSVGQAGLSRDLNGQHSTLLGNLSYVMSIEKVKYEMKNNFISVIEHLLRLLMA